MKPISRAILICLLPLAVLRAQEQPAPQQELKPFQVEFSNLPEEKRKEYTIKLRDAKRLFGEKRVFEAVDRAAEANRIFKKDPELLTLLGACQVEFRNFDKAMEYFKVADELIPDQASVLFNIAELRFVTKDWTNAEMDLAKVLKLTSTDPANLQLSRLVEFKLLLTKLKLGKNAEAQQLAKKYNFLDDSPYPFYAEAAIAFDAKKEVEAEAAMSRANRIFMNPAMVSPWQDTMVEHGYIKGFFGGDEDPASAQ